MADNRVPIVGGYHHPPALALMSALPVGAPLTLIAEPDNQYDPNAIGVWLYSKDIPDAARPSLEESLPQFGQSWDSIKESEVWMLGYIPKNLAAEIKASGRVRDNEPVEVTFCTNPQGQPRIKFAETQY